MPAAAGGAAAAGRAEGSGEGSRPSPSRSVLVPSRLQLDLQELRDWGPADGAFVCLGLIPQLVRATAAHAEVPAREHGRVSWFGQTDHALTPHGELVSLGRYLGIEAAELHPSAAISDKMGRLVD